MMLGSFAVVLDRRFRLKHAVEPETAHAEPEPVPPAKLADEHA
jgi:hypothetical protein